MQSSGLPGLLGNIRGLVLASLIQEASLISFPRREDALKIGSSAGQPGKGSSCQPMDILFYYFFTGEVFQGWEPQGLSDRI